MDRAAFLREVILDSVIGSNPIIPTIVYILLARLSARKKRQSKEI